MSKKYCVIMAGGIGTRFWPISRASCPKQFLDILGTGKTFIRSTFERFLPIIPVENFLVVTNAGYKDMVLEQIPELKEHQILCEPVGRNTAPCIAYAAFRLNAVDPGAQMIVTPSDHLIFDEKLFLRVIDKSVEFVRGHDALMTIGLKPTSPNTGYGYIQIEEGCDPGKGVCKVKTFTEKPGLEMALAFIESGEFFWNSGIFVWKTNDILAALHRHLPEMYELFAAAEGHYGTPAEAKHMQDVYSNCRGISIDFGVMEKADNVYVNCSEFGWSDIGTWGALYEFSPKDANENVVPRRSQLYATKGCVVKAPEDKLVVVDGLEDYMVVDTGDVLFIAPRSNEQNIRRYTEDIKFNRGDDFI